jgi:putative acetyltransferase
MPAPPSPTTTLVSARIRDYVPGDHSSVVRLVVDVLAEFGFSSQVGGIERDLQEIGDRYAGADAGFWVAERDDEIAGTVAVRRKDSGTCELKRLYVHPAQRGTGLGQRLYAHAETFARDAGYERIWLDSSRRFTKAHRLYERNGFVLLERLENDWEDNVYEKRLRDA